MLSLGGLLRALLTMMPLAYLAIVVAMYLKQDEMTFAANPVKSAPEDAGIGNAEVVPIATKDGETLNAWYTSAPEGQPTILFLHGNGGNISHRPERYRYYTSQGFGVLFVDYRGYGGSTGIPSETGLLIDSEAAYDWLLSNGVSPEKLVVAGESLGTGIAVKLAAKRQIAALSLTAPYSSLADIAAAHYWWLPVRLLIKNPIDATADIASVKVPLLVHHGDADQTIPIAFGRKLFALANEPKEFITIPGADHFIFTEETFAREAAFFRASISKK